MIRPTSSAYILIAMSGILLFSLGIWRAHILAPTGETPVALAQMELTYGKAFILEKGDRVQVKAKAPLYRLTEIATDDESEAVLYTPAGGKVRVLENSLISIDSDLDKVVLVIKSGDIRDESSDEAARQIIVSRNGLRRNLALEPKKGGRKKDAAKSATRTARSDNPYLQRSRPLTVELIQETMKNKKNLFFKCYSQLLQRTPGATGEASLAFTIEQTGNVSNAEVSNSSFKDPQFRRCLTEAVKRVEFKSFSGDSIQALFPIRFE